MSDDTLTTLEVKSEVKPVIKAGYQTTEFWLTVSSTLIGLLLASGLIHAGTPVDRVIGLAASVLGTLGYTVSRGIAKS